MTNRMQTARRLVLTGLAAACLIAARPGQAAADVLRTWQSGDWMVGAYTNNETKAFENCRGYRATDTGGSFSLAEVRSTNWVLVFASSMPYQAPVNTPVQIGVRIDQGQRRLLAVHVSSPTVMQGGVPATSELVEAIRRGHTLSFDMPDGHHGTVNLDGVSRLTADLSQCVQAQLAAERSMAPGAAPTPQPTPQPAPTAAQPAQGVLPAAGPQLELAATRIATNLLLQSKLPNARLLAPAETPAALRGMGAAWTSDAGFGSVSVIPDAPGRDVQRVALETIVGGANACKGEFAAGRSTSLVDDTLVTKSFTACSDSGGTHSLRFFILHREASWYIVYVIVPPASAPNGGIEQASAPGPLQDANFQAVAVKAALYQ